MNDFVTILEIRNRANPTFFRYNPAILINPFTAFEVGALSFVITIIDQQSYGIKIQKVIHLMWERLNNSSEKSQNAEFAAALSALQIRYDQILELKGHR